MTQINGANPSGFVTWSYEAIRFGKSRHAANR